jgi:hypothetical protein
MPPLCFPRVRILRTDKPSGSVHHHIADSNRRGLETPTSSTRSSRHTVT